MHHSAAGQLAPCGRPPVTSPHRAQRVSQAGPLGDLYDLPEGGARGASDLLYGVVGEVAQDRLHQPPQGQSRLLHPTTKEFEIREACILLLLQL